MTGISKYVPDLSMCLFAIAMSCSTEHRIIEQRRWNSTERIPEPVAISKQNLFGDTLEVMEHVSGSTTTIQWFDRRDTSSLGKKHPYTESYVHVGTKRPGLLECDSKLIVPCDSVEFIFCTDLVVSG